MKVPKHIEITPDGNRRWADTNKMTKEKGYEYGIGPGLTIKIPRLGVNFDYIN